MPESSDLDLLKAYATDHSEAAFGALVSRHINLVYSSAFRHVSDAHAAQEITQAVFVILAKKASTLSAKTVLPGWLYKTTQLTAANFLRTERRRQQREQEAYMQSTLHETSGDWVWQQIAPQLDEAMAHLGESDRNAIVLRFFENKNLREVGLALGASEDAAKMRVNRALEKLRKIFGKRGISLTTAIIAAAVSANSVQAAPVGLAATMTATAVNGAVISSSTLTLIKGALKIMAWSKVKTAVIAGVVVLLVAGTTTLVMGKIKQYQIDVNLSDWELTKFKTAPPMVLVQRTHFPQPAHLTKDGKSYVNANIEEETGKMAGRHVWLKFVVVEAYNFQGDQIIFPPDISSTDYYDFLVTTSDHPREKLQERIKQKLGLVAHCETRGRHDVLVVEKAEN